MEVTSKITYRPHEERDIPGLVRLWSEETPWGDLDEATWRSWHTGTPHGDCSVIVAVDANGSVVGQQVFTPSKLWADGNTVDALRLSAPIVRTDLRGFAIGRPDHPVYQLSRVGAETAMARGCSVIYSLPSRAFLPLFAYAAQLGLPAFDTREVPCMTLPLDDIGQRARGGGPRLEAGAEQHFGPEYSELWKSAVSTLPIRCGVERGPQWIRWRNGRNTVVSVRGRSGELMGYAAFKRDGLLFDFLARTPDVSSSVLRKAVEYYAHEIASTYDDSSSGSLELVKVMACPVLTPTLQELGASPDRFRFAFACVALDPDLPPCVGDADSWYTMPGD